MSEEKKKTDEEQTETGTQPPNEQTPETGKPNDDELSANETKPESLIEEKTDAAPPELSENDKLKEENFRLKTQLEAIKIGFIPDVIEDAVILAENIVKRDRTDITKALQTVAKKYPEWSSRDNKKINFRVGADSSEQNVSNDDKISRAFGIKKK